MHKFFPPARLVDFKIQKNTDSNLFTICIKKSKQFFIYYSLTSSFFIDLPITSNETPAIANNTVPIPPVRGKEIGFLFITFISVVCEVPLTATFKGALNKVYDFSSPFS